MLTCWMWLLVKSGSLLMICLMAELRESPTSALQARARIRSASVMGIFTDSSDSSTCRRPVSHQQHLGHKQKKNPCDSAQPSHLYPIVVLHHLPHVGQHFVVSGRLLLRVEGRPEGDGGEQRHGVQALVRSAHTVSNHLKRRRRRWEELKLEHVLDTSLSTRRWRWSNSELITTVLCC